MLNKFIQNIELFVLKFIIFVKLIFTFIYLYLRNLKLKEEKI